MAAQRSVDGWTWRLVLSGAVHALGMVVGLALVAALGLSMPRPVPGAGPAAQSLLMLLASIVIALGMAALAVGLPGNRWQRAAVLAWFMFVVQGVGNAIEASIFTTLGGTTAMALLLLPASVLGAVAVSWLFPAPDATRQWDGARTYLAGWRAGTLASRLALAVAAFPFIYFLFGTVIAPIVVPYYERLEFLRIPPMPVLLGVLFVRSVLLLLASLPVLALWRASRSQLIVGLGLAHFVAVGLAGLIQGTFLPAILRWTHGLEVFAGSMCYGLVLAWLLFPREGAPPVAQHVAAHPLDRRSASEATRAAQAGAVSVGALAARIAVLTVVLVFVQGVTSRFLPAAEAGQPAPDPSGGFLATVVGVLLLQTLALAYPVLRSRWHGWLLAVTTFAVYFGTVTFQSQIESMLYLSAHMSPAMLRGIVLMGLVTALVFSPALVLGLGRWRSWPPFDEQVNTRLRMPGTTLAWRLLLGTVVFVALYYLFGYYVAWKNPALRDYYGGTDPGTFLAQMSGIVRDTPGMLSMQFARGLFWVLIALPVIRMMKGPWWEAGLALSLLFSVPTVYLLFPNPLMPEAVRMTHLVETAPYQFLFGWFVAWLFTREPGTRLPCPIATRRGRDR